LLALDRFVEVDSVAAALEIVGADTASAGVGLDAAAAGAGVDTVPPPDIVGVDMAVPSTTVDELPPPSLAQPPIRSPKIIVAIIFLCMSLPPSKLFCPLCHKATN